jgi:hypothetical protein
LDHARDADKPEKGISLFMQEIMTPPLIVGFRHVTSAKSHADPWELEDSLKQ